MPESVQNYLYAGLTCGAVIGAVLALVLLSSRVRKTGVFRVRDLVAPAYLVVLLAVGGAVVGGLAGVPQGAAEARSIMDTRERVVKETVEALYGVTLAETWVSTKPRAYRVDGQWRVCEGRDIFTPEVTFWCAEGDAFVELPRVAPAVSGSP